MELAHKWNMCGTHSHQNSHPRDLAEANEKTRELTHKDSALSTLLEEPSAFNVSGWSCDSHMIETCTFCFILSLSFLFCTGSSR